MGMGLYIHIPFCARRCSYCDFCTVEYDGNLVRQYHDLLKKEVEMYPASERVETLYFGGGSPSLYPVELLRDLMSFISCSFDAAPVEVTIEANPWELNLKTLSSGGILDSTGSRSVYNHRKGRSSNDAIDRSLRISETD